MNMNPEPIDDLQLSAWLDGELAGPEHQVLRERIEAWLREHPEDAARVRLWAADREGLRAALAPTVDEPVPERLKRVVAGAGSAEPHWKQAAMAGGLLLAGALLGGLGTWQVQRGQQMAAAQAPAGAWLGRASAAHALYVPEQRHPVEVSVAAGDRAQEEHLVRWLTKRLATPVHTFDLRALGFELVGGRLLPDAAGPSAQLMYQDGSGQRVTVYLRKPEAGTRTAFRFQRDGEVGLFYWAEDGYGCALVGNLPRERLLALAEAVYRQVESAIVPGAPAASVPAPQPAPIKPMS